MSKWVNSKGFWRDGHTARHIFHSGSVWSLWLVFVFWVGWVQKRRHFGDAFKQQRLSRHTRVQECPRSKDHTGTSLPQAFGTTREGARAVWGGRGPGWRACGRVRQCVPFFPSPLVEQSHSLPLEAPPYSLLVHHQQVVEKTCHSASTTPGQGQMCRGSRRCIGSSLKAYKLACREAPTSRRKEAPPSFLFASTLLPQTCPTKHVREACQTQGRLFIGVLPLALFGRPSRPFVFPKCALGGL